MYLAVWKNARYRRVWLLRGSAPGLQRHFMVLELKRDRAASHSDRRARTLA